MLFDVDSTLISSVNYGSGEPALEVYCTLEGALNDNLYEQALYRTYKTREIEIYDILLCSYYRG